MECSHKEFILTDALPPHYKKKVCAECGKFLGFQSKPDQNKSKRPAGHTTLVQKYEQGYCELCLRAKESLPPNQCLEAHHVIPYQFGGESSRENIWIVCTPCHKIIEHYRIYLGHYGGQFKFIPDGEGTTLL